MMFLIMKTYVKLETIAKNKLCKNKIKKETLKY